MVTRGQATGHDPNRSATLAPTYFSRHPERVDIPATPELRRVQRFLLRLNVEHLHGPEAVELAQDELVVLCLLRNGRPYVKTFVEHHLSLGAKHIVLLDNGSTDGTIEALKAYENVTVLKTTMPFRRYQLLMRQYLVEQYGRNRWSLLVDIDEFFEYPFSDVISLKSLLRYLNEHQYTAVAAHMLDMFPEKPLAEITGDEDVPLKELHRFYDISNISAFDYQDAKGVGNVVSNEDIEILQGGVQRTVFNISPLLIKHPLIFYDDELKPVDRSEHWAGNARVADFSGVLFHYKLLGTLYGLVRREVSERSYVNRHAKYEKYLKVLDAAPELLIKRETSRELKHVNDLVGTQFAVVSREYMRFVESEAQKVEGYTTDGELERAYGLFFKARTEARERSREATQLQQKNMRLRRRIKDHEQSENQEHIRREREVLRGRLERKDQRIEELESANKRLEDQLSGIQSSRTWRLLDGLNRLRLRVLGRRS